VAFGAGTLAVALGGLAAIESNSATRNYDSARGMLQGNTLQAGADPARYKELVSRGDSARAVAYVALGAAVASVAVAGVLGYFSYKRTGEIGPFRF
jgi:hypothetical protein